MKTRTLRLAIVLGLSLAALPVRGAVPPPENPQEKDAVAYKQAYSLVLEEKWEEARKAMEKLAVDFPVQLLGRRRPVLEVLLPGEARPVHGDRLQVLQGVRRRIPQERLGRRRPVQHGPARP